MPIPQPQSEIQSHWRKDHVCEGWSFQHPKQIFNWVLYTGRREPDEQGLLSSPLRPPWGSFQLTCSVLSCIACRIGGEQYLKRSLYEFCYIWCMPYLLVCRLFDVHQCLQSTMTEEPRIWYYHTLRHTSSSRTDLLIAPMNSSSIAVCRHSIACKRLFQVAPPLLFTFGNFKYNIKFIYKPVQSITP